MEERVFVNGNPKEIAGFLLNLLEWRKTEFRIDLYDGLTTSEIINEKTSFVESIISWMQEDENYSGIFYEIHILKISIHKIPNNRSMMIFQFESDNPQTKCSEIRKIIMRELESQEWLSDPAELKQLEYLKDLLNSAKDQPSGKGGRNPSMNYAKIFLEYIEHPKSKEAFDSWCKLEKIENPDMFDRKKFNAAMDRKIKKLSM